MLNIFSLLTSTHTLRCHHGYNQNSVIYNHLGYRSNGEVTCPCPCTASQNQNEKFCRQLNGRFPP